MSARDRGRTVRRKDLFSMFYMISAIIVFQGMLKSSGAVDMLSREFIRRPIPLVPITMILPFRVGPVSGIAIAIACVGTAFPIRISLIHGLGQGPLMLLGRMPAMVSGYVGAGLCCDGLLRQWSGV